MSSSGSGWFFIATDPDQEKLGYYKIIKTNNLSTSMIQLNNARALKDFKVVKSFQCSDLKKAEDFIKSAMKNKFVTGSNEWIKLPNDTALPKIVNTIETLVEIVNNAE